MSVGTEPGSSVRQGRRQKPAVHYRTEDGTLRLRAAKKVNKWGQVETPSTLAEEDLSRLPELPIPGRGERREECGEPVPVRFCRECGKPQWTGKTCGRSVCPRCWIAWDRDRTVSITAKLEGLRRYKETQVGERWTGLKFHHITLSPPEGFAVRSDHPIERGKEIGKELLSEIGAETGVLVYHPFRLDKEEKADIFEEDPDGLTWLDVIREAGSMEEIREKLSYEPHFHAVVLSRYVTGGRMTKTLEDKTGWVIERITKPGENVSIGNAYDLNRVVGYCLSHAGIRTQEDGPNRAAYWYFGEVANFRPTRGVEDDMRNCFAAVSERILGVEVAGIARPVVDSEDGEEDETLVEEGEHKHRMLPIGRAFEYTSSGPWRDSAGYLSELYTALHYRALMCPRPALPPPPSD